MMRIEFLVRSAGRRLGLLAFVALPVLGGAGEVFTLAPVKLRRPSSSYLSSPPSSYRPPNMGSMPALSAGGTVFMDLRLGDGLPRLVAIERRTQDENGGYRVYVDMNGDRSLSDETPCETVRSSSRLNSRIQYTPPLTVPVTYRLPSGEVQHDYRFSLGFYPSSSPDRGRLFNYVVLQQLRGWGGVVSFGDKKYRITLSDGDGDAVISIKQNYSRDNLQLVGLADGAVQKQQPLTRCVEVDNTFYSLEVQPDGSQVTVSRYTGPVGAVALFASDGKGRPANLSQLSLSGVNLSVSYSSRDTIPASRELPCGNYYINYHIGTTSPTAFFRLSNQLRVEADTTTRIDCGGPVAITGSVSQEADSDGTVLSVSVETATATGHDYQPIGAREADRVDVLGPDGVSQGTGNMEYG